MKTVTVEILISQSQTHLLFCPSRNHVVQIVLRDAEKLLQIDLIYEYL